VSETFVFEIMLQQLMTTDDNRRYLTYMTHYYFNPMKQSEISCRLLRIWLHWQPAFMARGSLLLKCDHRRSLTNRSWPEHYVSIHLYSPWILS
jgi:hypothetical protein